MEQISGLDRKGASVVLLGAEIFYISAEVDSMSLRMFRDAAVENFDNSEFIFPIIFSGLKPFLG